MDAENFSGNSDRGYQTLGQEIPRVLEQSFRRSGLDAVWKDPRFPRHSGDGFVIGMEPQYLPSLIHPFLETLQEELRRLQPRLASQDRALRLRLRASIDVGPLPDTGGRSHIDAMGEAMVQVHRLLDASEVRAELKASDPDTTLLAAIVSRRVYEDAVLSGFCGVHPSRFRPVHVSIPAKNFAAEGYLHIPTPSIVGAAAEPAAPDREPDPPASRSEAAPPNAAGTPNQFTNHGGAENIVQAGTVDGGIRFRKDHGR
ncbi:hypothetical protein [Murinocardiopsis flavida]|uniref:hypothetical protein n=1 Tax=Murinocardiopsis flavida TaxID=645275 RepID=UPI001FEA84D0|nr:hypothetical protein [Murinocardiopsis flavida]